jgi:hypothetical protein
MSFHNIMMGVVAQSEIAVTPSSPIWDSLVHYYNFDSDATDSKGSADGSVNGATNTSGGINNNCYTFDGVNDYIDVSSFTAHSSSTFSMWVNPDAYGYRRLLDCWVSSIHYPELRFDNNAELYYGDNTKTCATSGSDISTGSWNHVCVVKTGTNLDIYINGTSRYSGTGFDGTERTGILNIGDDRAHSTSSKTFDGEIDELGYWNVALDSDDVTELYNSGSGKFYTG